MIRNALMVDDGLRAWEENFLIVGEQMPWRDWRSWQQGKKQRERRSWQFTWESNQWKVKGGVSWERDKAGMTRGIFAETKGKRTRQGQSTVTCKSGVTFLIRFKYLQIYEEEENQELTKLLHWIFALKRTTEGKDKEDNWGGERKFWQCLHLKPRASHLLAVAHSSPALARSPLSSACTATVTILHPHCQVLSAPRQRPMTWTTTPPPPQTPTCGSMDQASTPRRTCLLPGHLGTLDPLLSLSTMACRGLTWVLLGLGVQEGS